MARETNGRGGRPKGQSNAPPKGHRSIIQPEVDTRAEATEQALRVQQALEMRAGGASFQEIADQLGWKSRQGAWEAVNGALARLETESAAELRALHLERLRLLLGAVWPNAVDPEANRPGTNQRQTHNLHLGT